jgi:hypothetical protein
MAPTSIQRAINRYSYNYNIWDDCETACLLVVLHFTDFTASCTWLASRHSVIKWGAATSVRSVGACSFWKQPKCHGGVLSVHLSSHHAHKFSFRRVLECFKVSRFIDSLQTSKHHLTMAVSYTRCIWLVSPSALQETHSEPWPRPARSFKCSHMLTLKLRWGNVSLCQWAPIRTGSRYLQCFLQCSTGINEATGSKPKKWVWKKTINALWNQYQRANGILWPYRGYFLPGIEGILISLARESFAAEQHR